jgi:hypothetical protein
MEHLLAPRDRMRDRADLPSDPGAPDYPYGERGQTQRDRRVSGGRF